jgi:hypothetical protein
MTRIVTFLLAASLAGASAPAKVTLSAPGGHRPHVNVHWPYAVHATVGGKPAKARLTAQIVDPIGGRHPVEFGTSTKPITNWPFKGTFRDFIVWTPDSRGVPLTLRLVVKVGGVTKVLTYAVTPRA